MPRGEKQGLVAQAVERAVGPFTVTDLQRECPGVSLDTIRHVLKQLRDQGAVECLGRWGAAETQAGAGFPAKLGNI